MKRLFSALLCLLLLAGCGGGGTAPAEPDGSEQTAPAEDLGPAPAGLTMELEHDIYDPSLTSYTYFIHNDTGQPTGIFGTPFTIQRKDGGDWADLTVKDDVGWDDIGYTLEPGGTMALRCGFWPYQEAPETGEYRLVKEVDGALLTAEFALGESIYTAETPYGYGPLEDLPVGYGAADAREDGVTLFTAVGEEHTQAVTDFLEKVALEVPCQLRTVQDYGQSLPMFIDVIYEDGCFLWRMRSGSDPVVEQRFSYVVTDGTDVYLSNGADWESTKRYDSDTVFLVPPMAGGSLVPAAEEMTSSRLEGNVTRYKIWSADGIWEASLREEPTVFSVSWRKEGKGAGGNTYDLQDWDGLETAITGLVWREDDILAITCDTADGGTSRLTFDPESGELKNTGTPEGTARGTRSEENLMQTGEAVPFLGTASSVLPGKLASRGNRGRPVEPDVFLKEGAGDHTFPPPGAGISPRLLSWGGGVVRCKPCASAIY